MNVKILITNFEWMGEHYDEYEAEISELHSIDDILNGKLEKYIKDSLDDLTDCNLDR